VSDASETADDDHRLLALVYGSLVLFALGWRVHVLINDSFVFANTLVALRNGHLHLAELVYIGIVPAQPGMYVSDGALYGRNYGQVVLALPVLLALQGVAQVVDPLVVIAGLWSVLLALFVEELRQVAGWSRTVTYAAGGVALGLFGVNLWLLEPVSRNWYPHIALQLTSICVATATVGLVYVLGRDVASRRVGVFVGGLAALASPVGFWATLSKRHTLTGFLPLAVLYGLYRSRTADAAAEAVRFRILAYGSVGLTAWVHSVEGLLLALALVPLDLLTARTSVFRSTGIAGVTLTIAFLPFFVTNALISGNPLLPPRALRSATTDDVVAILGRENDAAGAVEQDAAAVDAATPEGVIDAVTAAAGNRAATFVSYVSNSAGALAHPERLYTVFVRSSRGLFSSGQFTVPPRNFAVLESMPVLGVVVGAVLLAVRSTSAADWTLPDSPWEDPRRVPDAFAVLFAAWLLLIYVPRLPLNATFTVRYLYPIYPLGLYAVARLEFVQRTVEAEWRLLLVSYGSTVVVGGAGLLGVLAIGTTFPGGFQFAGLEKTMAFQIHALAGTTTGVLVAVWSAYAVRTGGGERTGAVSLGSAAGVTSLFLVFTAFRYYAFTSQFAIPISRVVARGLGAV
jgi:hypothetical protein